MRGMAGTGVAVLVLAFSGPALAYSDPSAFVDDALLGGGQGRMFTGSPRDGLTCEVCHSGGPRVNVSIESFPGAFAPGQTYEIKVVFAGFPEKVAGAVEITDASGRAAGTLAVPPADALEEVDQCADFPVPAASIQSPEEGREVVGLAACGARRIRFQWTAPMVASGPLNFNGAVVNGDGAATHPSSEVESDVEGDGVTLISRKLLPAGTTPPGDIVAGGCSAAGVVAAPLSPVGQLLCVVLCGMAAVVLNRRRRPRR